MSTQRSIKNYRTEMNNQTKKNQQSDTKKTSSSGNLKGIFGGGSKSPRSTRTAKSARQGPDLVLLDKISEEYILSPNSFQDIEKVELKIVTLNEQHALAKDAETKKFIKDISEKYQQQLKRLELKQGGKTETKITPRGTQQKGKGTGSTTFVINEKDEIVEQTPKASRVTDVKDKESTNKGINKGAVQVQNPYGKQTNTFSTPPRNISKGITTIDTPNSKGRTPDHSKRKYNAECDNETETKSQKKNNVWNQQDNRDLSSTSIQLFGNENNQQKSSNRETESTKDEKDETYIQLRFQFKAKTRKNNSPLKHEQIVSDILYNFMKCAHTIDKKAAIMPWSDLSTHTPLNGNELRMHVGEKINEYIHIPDLKENLIEGKIYYQNGIKLKTEMSVYQFTETWSNKRYASSDNGEKIEWVPIKPAEMQRADIAYPLGYFVGTTERGDYRTINKAISEYTNTKTEVSFQFVNQSGVSPRVWQFAREQAMRADDDVRSKTHKRIKFRYAPAALTVYVSDKRAIKEARRKMIVKYGKLVNGQWPVMPDGSRMRFVPIMTGTVSENAINKKKQKVFKHLHEQLLLQASSKAGEILLDLEMWDLFTRHDYLHGSTLEEVIHGLTSTSKEGVPIFKHIVRKWSRSSLDENYEVAVAPSMLQEAQETLYTIRPALKRKFGIKVNNHFNPPSGRRFALPSRRSDEYDPEIEDFLIESTTNDTYSRVLIEGMEGLDSFAITNGNNNRSQPKAMLINEGHQEKAQAGDPDDRSLKRTTKSFEIMEVNSTTDKSKDRSKHENDIMSTFSNLTKNSTKGGKALWEEITIADAYEDCEPANEKEIGTIEEKISLYNITMEEIEKWKNKYCEEFSRMTSGKKMKEFQTLMRVIDGVLEERKETQESNKEVELYADLLNEEPKKASQVETLSGNNTQNQQANPLIYSTPALTSDSEAKNTGGSAGRER